MAQPHVPTSLDQITAEVMTDAFRSSGFDEVTVSSVSAERIAIGEGFLGELARLTLDYSAGTGPARREGGAADSLSNLTSGAHSNY